MKARTLGLVVIAALAVTGWVVLFTVLGTDDGSNEDAPSEDSVIGFWVHGDRSLLLAANGTFESRVGCHGSDGTWVLEGRTVALEPEHDIVGPCPNTPAQPTPDDPEVRPDGSLAGYLRFDTMDVPVPDDLLGSWTTSAGETVVFQDGGELTGVCPTYDWSIQDGDLVTEITDPVPCPSPPGRSVTYALTGPAQARITGDLLFLRGEDVTARLARTGS